MRVLAIDHGSKRVGLAMSDEMQLIAQPMGYFPAEPRSRLLDRLQTLVEEKHVGLLLVGLPRKMDGSYGPAAEKVQQFVDQLRTIVTVPVRTWDERLTSAQAERFLIGAQVRRAVRREKVDQTAAAILLQSYLDFQSETESGPL